MNEKDAATLAVLASLGLRSEKQLTPQQEEIFKLAQDPESQYYADLVKLFF